MAQSVKAIAEVCAVRRLLGFRCLTCECYGEACERVKHKHKVERPYQLLENGGKEHDSKG